MKRSKKVSAEARKTVVQGAAEMLRARGIEGVSVADVMAAAGMTHGGFYKLFKDKEALVEEAFDLASQDSARALRGPAEHAPKGRAIQTMIDAYLSPDHRANLAGGCAFAAHASEAARQRLGGGFRRAFTAGLYRVFESVGEVATQDDRPIRRQEALALFSSLIGALVLARGTDDQTLAWELLESVKSRAAALALEHPKAEGTTQKKRRPKKKAAHRFESTNR
jgi:TetR/AcrR family transcriptional regulator, transcriptional repressor for nem operon